MKKLILIAILTASSIRLSAEKPKPNPADFTLNMHISSAKYVLDSMQMQILSVTVCGMHYEIIGPTSSARTYGSHGNGLLNPGDYKARFSNDEHKTPFESFQEFEVFFPDGTKRVFSVYQQGE